MTNLVKGRVELISQTHFFVVSKVKSNCSLSCHIKKIITTHMKTILILAKKIKYPLYMIRFKVDNLLISLIHQEQVKEFKDYFIG